jgi:ABC-type Na+ efflux pump permease subunit
MVKQLGYDTIMLFAVLFGALTASLSISEEIEGRTAITVMSKPVSRRQFMLGKYAGIILASLFMFGLLGVFFEGVLLVKHWFDRLEPISTVVESQATQARIGVVPTPAWVTEALDRWALPSQVSDVLRGAGQWLAHSLDTIPGLILCFSQVLVLVGLAVALATRLPMVVNLVTVLMVYFLAHLTPVLVIIARRAQGVSPGSPVPRLLGFVAQVFDTLLPDLGAFRVDPTLLSDVPPPPGPFAQYVASVTLYGVLYAAIVLLFGLILFEDRDLA